MKVCTVVGARPQFIKAAALSRILRKNCHELLIHTGQHYDYNMSDVFFDELQIPLPEYNLGISGGSHGSMTGKMLASIEEVLQKECPDIVLVYGDTNSTLAGALAAVKLHIPVCHVEAGVRMGTLHNPEEVNRVLTDRISQLMMCCTNAAVNNLAIEGLCEGVYNTGDLMYDALLYYGQNLLPPTNGKLLGLDGIFFTIPKRFYLLTCHREENTGSDAPLYEILLAMNQLDAPVVWPVHPRNRQRAFSLKEAYGFSNILLLEPVSYLDSLWLVKNAQKVVTDSGGLQREAWFYDRQCITLLDYPVWPETFDGNINQLCSPDSNMILEKLSVIPDFSQKRDQFGDGTSAVKITRIICKYLTGDL